MFGRSWRLARVGGIDVRVDFSWILIAGLVTYSLAIAFTDSPRIGNGLGIALALLSAALFFGSVLGHELAHAGMARARGIRVLDITLWMFGGLTRTGEERRPLDEFLVTAVGPGSSFLFSGMFYALSQVVGFPLHGVFRYLGFINFILALFNLLPGFPLDGGRILRSVVWGATGNLERATRVAGTVGMVTSMGLIAWGLWRVVRGDPEGGIWVAFIGWFLFQSARSSVGQQQLRRRLARGTAEQAMGPPPAAVPAGMTLSEALDRYLRGNEGASFPVLEGDQLVGLLTFESAARIGREDPLRPVRDALIPLERARTVSVDDTLDRVAERIGGGAALVLRGPELVGAISGADLSRWLQLRPA